MKYQNIIKKYCDLIVQNNTEELFSLFAKNTQIITPFGVLTPEKFLSYINKTIRSTINLREQFISQFNPKRIAVHISVENLYQDTNKVVTEAIDVFEFDENDKICKLEMYYDPSIMKKFLEQMQVI